MPTLKTENPATAATVPGTNPKAQPKESSKWQVYEQRKAELQRQHLSNKEYQDAIKRLADELGI